ncbi:MAG: cation:proton antiporter [Acetobacteraceae bacterium]
MDAAHDASFHKLILIVLGTAGVVIPVFHRMRINPVFGFIVVGMAVGPFGIGSLAAHYPWLTAVMIDSPESIRPIAELGVALLLFMIGLGLSFERLWLMRRLVFGMGLLQVILTAGLLSGAGLVAGLPADAAVVIGMALAMSSTAVVLQVLAQSKRLNTPAGRGSFAVLLFQDLAVVPALFAVNALAPDAAAAGASEFGMALLQSLLAVAAIVALGRLVLRPLFRTVARTRSTELFVATCLFIVVASALATAAAGISMAIGALIGGLLLAGTEYRRQVEITIEPFKGLLVGVFLISIGMSLDIGALFNNPLLVLGAAVGLVALKLLLITPLLRLFGFSWSAALESGLMLGPAGEFGFVILALAASKDLLARNAAEFVLLIAALTMATIPFLARAGQALAPRVSRKAPVDPDLQLPNLEDAAPRVIVVGFGRVGQMLAAMLAVHKVPYVALDLDPDLVGRHRARGTPIYYGDLTQLDLLRRLHLEHVHALVITLDDSEVANRLVAAARSERPDLFIISRARDAHHAALLYRTGVSDAVPETVEASLQLAEAVLVDIGIPMGPVIASIHERRAELQAEIKAMAPGAAVRPLSRRRLRDFMPEPEAEPAGGQMDDRTGGG